ncbi:GNAT family N-acetyltransferase [Streptomyces humi]
MTHRLDADGARHQRGRHRPAVRRRGHAAWLVGTLVTRVVARGERPFPHVAEANATAIALYGRLGSGTGAKVAFRGCRTP